MKKKVRNFLFHVAMRIAVCAFALATRLADDEFIEDLAKDNES